VSYVKLRLCLELIYGFRDIFKSEFVILIRLTLRMTPLRHKSVVSLRRFVYSVSHVSYYVTPGKKNQKLLKKFEFLDV